MGVVWLVLGINAVVWILLFIGWRFQRARIEEKLKNDVGLTGEYLVLGPQNGYYAKTKGIANVMSMGVMALTNKRLMFRVLFGMGFDIPLADIAEVSEAKWCEGMYRNGRNFMILTQRDGSKIGFQTKDQQRWSEEIRSQLSS
jgi:hypothetical protein